MDIKKLFLFIWVVITRAVSQGKNPLTAVIKAIKAKKTYDSAYVAYDKALKELRKVEPEYDKACKKEKLICKLYDIELDRFRSAATELNQFVRGLAYHEYDAAKHRLLRQQYAQREKTLDTLTAAHETHWEEFFRITQCMDALSKNAEKATNAYDEAYDCLKSFGVLIEV